LIKTNNYILNGFVHRLVLNDRQIGGEVNKEFDEAKLNAQKALDDLFNNLNKLDLEKIQKALKALITYINLLEKNLSEVGLSKVNEQLKELNDMMTKYYETTKTIQ
jgi:hypothetical protein